MFAILDTDLRYTFVNNGFANIMGVKADYFDSKFHFDLFPNKMLQALFENVLKSGEEIMVKAQPIGGFLPKDDKKYWNWEIKALKSEKSIIGVSLTIIDVTSEIQALNHEAIIDKMFEEQFNRNLSGMYQMSLKGEILKCNNSYAKILGVESPDELIGENRDKFYSLSGDSFVHQLNEMVDGKIEARETEMLFPNGSSKCVLENGILIDTPEGDKIIEGSLIDITELKIAYKQLEKKQYELLKIQSQMLSAQMNPHFIFNTINSINSLILEENIEEALAFTGDLAKLIRQVLENSLNESIPLKEEVNFLNMYLSIEQKRLKTEFKYNISISGSDIYDNVSIPVLVVQPFVENAIHYAMVQNNNGKIDVRFSVFEEKVVCTVSDNGLGIIQSKDIKGGHQSLGINITKNRLNFYNSNKMDVFYGVEIQSKTNEGVLVVITLPNLNQ